MKLIVISALVAVCSAAPQYYQNQNYQNYQNAPAYYQARSQESYYQRPQAAKERNAAILRSAAETNEAGYNFYYDTENGIRAEESGREIDGIQAQGGYSYTGDDGKVYSVRYTAGANGFEAQGEHIPTPPPVPAEIARALQENARDEANGIFDDGSYHEGKYDSGVTVARQYQPAKQFYPAVRQPQYNY